MKQAILISLGLLGLGILVLLVRALPNGGPMVTVPLEAMSSAGAAGGPIDGVLEARVGWTAVSLALVSGLCFIVGWLWVPLSRRVLTWAENEPAIKEVFHYRGVRFVSDAPTQSMAALVVVAFFPLWVLLPAIHHVIGRALIPVPDHLIAESMTSVVMCLPLAVGYGIYRRGHAGRGDTRGLQPSPDLGDGGPRAR